VLGALIGARASVLKVSRKYSGSALLMSTGILLSDTGYCASCAALQGSAGRQKLHSYLYVATLAYLTGLIGLNCTLMSMY